MFLKRIEQRVKTMGFSSNQRNVKRPRTTVSRPIMPTGSSNFDEVIDDGLKVIDKTQFIQHFVESQSLVCRILRPRRFGKSTNLNMLKSFLSLGAKADDFKRFDIGKDQEFLDKHCGQYPVVFLDLKDCKGDSWEEMYKAFWRSIRATFQRHGLSPMNAFQELDPSEQDLYGAVHNEEFSVSLLLWLTVALYKKYDKYVIILIDEYDTPLNEAKHRGFYMEASTFFESLYSCSLKNNDALEKACLVGILHEAGPNNISTYSVSDETFSGDFGFTKEEISLYLDGNEEKVNQVMDWYDGYQYGSHSVVNPYSFMRCVSENKFVPAWARSSTEGALADVLREFRRYQILEILPLLENKDVEISCDTFSTLLANDRAHWDLDSVLSFLVLTGYLTFEKPVKGPFGNIVRVPNKEVRECLSNEIAILFQRQGSIEKSLQTRLTNILANSKFDKRGFR